MRWVGTGPPIITGATGSDETTFPMLLGPDLTHNGDYDVFVAKIVLDSDGDGAIDIAGNCPLVLNPGQEDADGDGIGDACEDGDGDGIFDMDDECPLLPTPTLIVGTAGDDTLTGTSGNDLIRGLDGNDTLRGGTGNDALDGGPDTDNCLGGIGTDTAVACKTITGIP